MKKYFIKHDLKKFDQEYLNRYETLIIKSTRSNLLLIQAKPKTLFVDDITNDPYNWLNNAYALYFNQPKNSIYIKDYILEHSIHK